MMQVAPIDSVYEDDANQESSATSIIIKDTVPLIDEQPQSKWLCLCRSVNCYHSFSPTFYYYYIPYHYYHRTRVHISTFLRIEY